MNFAGTLEISREKVVHFISISGKTRSNVSATSSVSGVAEETVALTSNPDSLLAKACSRVLPIKFTKAPGVTPGTNRFIASLLSCSRLFGEVPTEFDFDKSYNSARDWANSQSENAETVYLLGSGFLFPIAMYGVVKILEIAGSRAVSQLTEEFSHVNLLTLTKKDLVVILKGEAKEDPTGEKLWEELNREGYCAQILELGSGTSGPLETAISASIHLQYFALNIALRKGLRQPAFLTNQKLLDVSSRMIYLG